MSARICAKSIMESKDYDRLLNPVLKELRFWERMGNVLTKTSNAQQDTFIKLAQNPLVKWKIESGRSLRPYFRLLSGYFKLKDLKDNVRPSSNPFHARRKATFPIPER
jgi:hypothetical protein